MKGKILLALAALLLAGTGRLGARETEPRLFIIDDDVGMMKAMVWKAGSFEYPFLKITDPDGGLEMLYALREPKIKVLGITCAMGCSTTDVCMASVQKILELTGRTEVPLMRGASTPKDLGKETAAARFIIDTVMKNPGRVEIIATAPLTNIATAMMLEPELPKNWKALHLATGEFWGALGEFSDGAKFGRAAGYRDMNINVDVAAVRYVLEHGGDKVFIYPNEIMDQAFLTRADLKTIKQAGTPLSKWVASELAPMAAIESLVMRGFALHGVIGAAVAIDPELAEPPTLLRIKLAERKRGGYYFAISDDKNLPAYPVYGKLRDAQALEQRVVERSR